MDNNLLAESTADFDFSEEPASLWAELIADIRLSGKNLIRTRVLWGAHEQVRGIRDFSKSSRLRLEKFLALVQAQNLSVELEVGFPACKEAFPAWTHGMPHKALVPGGLWNDVSDGYALVPLPSLFDDNVLEGFKAFLGDVQTLSSLYRKPEGPISRVVLNLGVLLCDLNALECAKFIETLEARHGSIDALNTLYQTTFKNIASVGSRAGFRALMDRRPWIAAHDYQWCRRKMLLDVCDRLLGDGIELSSESGGMRGEQSWELAIDAMMMETGLSQRSECFPFTPGGLLHPMAVSSFRLGEYLNDAARSSGVAVTWLSKEGEPSCGTKPLRVVVCGKYLPRGVMADLETFAKDGGDLVFPWGLPQYDEQMKRFEKFSAKVKVPSQPPALGNDLWRDIERLVGAVRGAQAT